MNARRDGFTLIEVMIVAVLLAATLGAVYQALNVQELSYKTGSTMIRGQESMRTGLGILESELRELSTTGADIGGVDIRVAAADSVIFRAQRKLGFVCAIALSDNKVTLAVMGDGFVRYDSVLVFVDGDSLRSSDDAWVTSQVQDAATDVNTACATRFPGLPIQTLHVGAGILDGVKLHSPVRAFQWVLYGIREFPKPQGWSLARRLGDADATDYLVGGLAPPPNGVHFEYFDADGNTTANPSEITRMRIGMQVLDNGGGAGEPQALTTNLFFRNN